MNSYRAQLLAEQSALDSALQPLAESPAVDAPAILELIELIEKRLSAIHCLLDPVSLFPPPPPLPWIGPPAAPVLPGEVPF